MVSFKLNIADTKAGKCYKTEVKDQEAEPFIGLNIGEKINGSTFGLSDSEFQITGGNDYCGFPMRKGILGIRKKITIYEGVGFRGGFKGMKKRKTVCGHKINDKISAINLKVLKEGSKKLSDMFASEQKGKEDKPEEKSETKKEDKKVEAGDHAKKDETHGKKDKPKAEEKKEQNQEKQAR
jgi:small subunit ribosomal protein S6e